MTRDEAIKLMRAGKKVKHQTLPNQTFVINADGDILVEVPGQIQETSHLRIHLSRYDTGWELVSKRVNKWIHADLWIYIDKQTGAIKCFSSQPLPHLISDKTTEQMQTIVYLVEVEE
jgi:hypothetical protein